MGDERSSGRWIGKETSLIIKGTPLELGAVRRHLSGVLRCFAM
jgi:hypothetical protein